MAPYCSSLIGSISTHAASYYSHRHSLIGLRKTIQFKTPTQQDKTQHVKLFYYYFLMIMKTLFKYRTISLHYYSCTYQEKQKYIRGTCKIFAI